MKAMGMNTVMCCCRMRFSRLGAGGQVHSSALCCADVSCFAVRVEYKEPFAGSFQESPRFLTSTSEFGGTILTSR